MVSLNLGASNSYSCIFIGLYLLIELLSLFLRNKSHPSVEILDNIERGGESVLINFNN